MGTKTLVGCSVTPLLLTGVVVAALLWGGTAYVGLTRDQVELEEAWTRMENAWLHERQLVPELLALASDTAVGGASEFRDLSASLDRAGEFVLTPELLRDGVRLGQFLRAQAELEAEARRLVEEHGAALAARSPAAFARLREQLAANVSRVAEGRARFDDAVARYNRALARFPHRVVGVLFEFRPCGVPHAPGATAGAVIDARDATGAVPGGAR